MLWHIVICELNFISPLVHYNLQFELYKGYDFKIVLSLFAHCNLQLNFLLTVALF